jgi:hypothetical protein
VPQVLVYERTVTARETRPEVHASAAWRASAGVGEITEWVAGRALPGARTPARAR